MEGVPKDNVNQASLQLQVNAFGIKIADRLFKVGTVLRRDVVTYSTYIFAIADEFVIRD